MYVITFYRQIAKYPTRIPYILFGFGSLGSVKNPECWDEKKHAILIIQIQSTKKFSSEGSLEGETW